MKVSLSIPIVPVTLGGGYTFSDEIFRALLECAYETKHQFFIFEFGSKRQNADFPPNIRWISLSRNLGERIRTRLPYEFRRLRQIYKNSSAVTNVIRPFTAYRRKMLTEYGIDVTLSLWPGVPDDHLPFITTVFDLGHRVHPYFPELSMNGEWESREEEYKTHLPKAAKIITGTHAGKKQIIKFYGVPQQRISIIPLPTPSFALQASAESGEEKHTLQNTVPESYLFYPAQFWAHKNHVGLLNALKILRDSHQIRLPVVFSGSDKGNLKFVRQVVSNLGLNDQVYFLNFVTRDELVWLYRHALVMVFVTYLGPDNIPPLEAFALGCPVIASNVEGAKEQLHDAALLVNPANSKEIAEAIKQIYHDNTLRQTLINKGYERARISTGHGYIRSVFKLLDELELIRQCWG